jgi:hypothetical protein
MNKVRFLEMSHNEFIQNLNAELRIIIRKKTVATKYEIKLEYASYKRTDNIRFISPNTTAGMRAEEPKFSAFCNTGRYIHIISCS